MGHAHREKLRAHAKVAQIRAALDQAFENMSAGELKDMFVKILAFERGEPVVFDRRERLFIGGLCRCELVAMADRSEDRESVSMDGEG